MCECFSVGLIYHQFNKMQNIGGALEQWCSGTVLVSCCCWMSPCRGLVISYNQSSQSSQEAPKLASVGWRMCGRWRGTQLSTRHKQSTIYILIIFHSTCSRCDLSVIMCRDLESGAGIPMAIPSVSLHSVGCTAFALSQIFLVMN